MKEQTLKNPKKDYNYVDNNQLDELREKLGFYDN